MCEELGFKDAYRSSWQQSRHCATRRRQPIGYYCALCQNGAQDDLVARPGRPLRSVIEITRFDSRSTWKAAHGLSMDDRGTPPAYWQDSTSGGSC